MNEQNYLFFYLNTGGGHLAPAKAVINELSKKNPEINTWLIDGLDHSSKFVRFCIEDGYRFLQSKIPFVYETIYACNKQKIFAQFSANSFSKMVIKNIEQSILLRNPTKIFIFHFFLIKPVLEVIKKHHLNCSVFVVVTDPYTAHPLWFLNRNTNYLVFSELLKNEMIHSYRIHEKNIVVKSFINRAEFGEKVSLFDCDKLKLNIGLNLNQKVILIIGGADGIPGGKRLLEKLVLSAIDTQIIIICGKNRSLQRLANRLAKSCKKLLVFGFVNNVHEFMQVSDVIITKCGASTFTEVLLSGKTPFVVSYLWEQEKGNLDFILSNNLGIYQPNLNKISTEIIKLIQDDIFRVGFEKRIAAMSLKNGLFDVVEWIVKCK